MKLPTQAKPVARHDRTGQAAEMKAAGVNPQFWGTLWKAAKGALNGAMS